MWKQQLNDTSDLTGLFTSCTKRYGEHCEPLPAESVRAHREEVRVDIIPPQSQARSMFVTMVSRSVCHGPGVCCCVFLLVALQ